MIVLKVSNDGDAEQQFPRRSEGGLSPEYDGYAARLPPEP